MWIANRIYRQLATAPLLIPCLLIALAGLMLSPQLGADSIKIAVASNFTPTLSSIAKAFEQFSGHKVILINGSTGKHYAQIVNGAPYDAFFAADARTVNRLIDSGHAFAGSEFIYAIGKLVAWTALDDAPQPDADYLASNNYRRLAIANPKLAPYGHAARQALQRLGLWQSVQKRLVRGENISQAYQFVSSRNAEVGLVAFSQIRQAGTAAEGKWWQVPAQLYDPILQQATLLRESAAAREFLAFCKSESALKIIRDNGYHTPDADT